MKANISKIVRFSKKIKYFQINMIRPIDRKTTSKVVLIKLKKEFLKYEAKLK